MKKRFLYLMATIFLGVSCSLYAESIHHRVPFVSHINDPVYGPDYWLGMNIDNDAITQIRNKFESEHPDLVLNNRDDSHITIITPPEYQTILQPYLTPESIDSIAELANIQQSHFKVICYGRGVAYDNDQQLQTYFLVVESPDLIKLRKKIFDAYVKNGGDPSRFDPENFMPHITFGFTSHDLFESNGVYKQKNSCIQKWDHSML
jgi:2'-5' RNA ligase